MISTKHVPTVTKRPDRYRYHGLDITYRVHIEHGRGQRHVIEIEGITWPDANPEVCTDESFTGDWYIADDTGKEYLLCRGCGIDCT